MSPAAPKKKPATPEAPAGPPLLARLLCKTGQNAGLTFELASDRPVLIGRTPSAGLIVPDPMVSREHARVSFEAGRFILENLSGTNGTLLNGVPVERESLEHLDVIGFGPDSEFILRLDRRAPAPEGASQPVARVVLLPTGAVGQRVELGPGESTIGRAASNNVVLELKAVSSQHARVVVGPLQVELTDLGSANGTTVNEQRVSGTAILADGDTLVFGKVAGFVVQIEREAEPQEAPPPPSGWRLAGEEESLALNVPTEPGHYVIGRESSCQIVLENKKSVSRRHAELTVDAAGRLQIRDLASGNGTFVNSVKIRESALRLGDRLQIGLVAFRIEAR
jgi:pSer/pThr/pTyr-binding forkhead associated (FHA) protein